MRKDKIVYDTQELRGYVEAGKTNVQIANLMGVSTGTIVKWVKESGLTGIRFRGGKKKGREEGKKNLAVKKAVPAGYNADRHMCRTCRFRGYGHSSIKSGCDYILIVGHSRGCNVEDCNVYEKGRRIRSQWVG